MVWTTRWQKDKNTLCQRLYYHLNFDFVCTTLFNDVCFSPAILWNTNLFHLTQSSFQSVSVVSTLWNKRKKAQEQKKKQNKIKNQKNTVDRKKTKYKYRHNLNSIISPYLFLGFSILMFCLYLNLFHFPKKIVFLLMSSHHTTALVVHKIETE